MEDQREQDEAAEVSRTAVHVPINPLRLRGVEEPSMVAQKVILELPIDDPEMDLNTFSWVEVESQ